MPDPTTFERRLAATFQVYADGAPTEVDARAVAAAVAQAAASRGETGLLGAMRRTLRDPRRVAGLLLVIALLAAVIAAGLLLAGSQPRLPPPFGPTGNGLVGYDVGGDLYVGDPATGAARLVLGGPARESDPAFSLDGQRIAVIQSTSDPGRDRVVVVGVDGTHPIVVTPDPLSDLTSVSWAPDGRSVWLVALVGGQHALLRADSGGAGVRTIVSDVDVDPDGVSFRPPDGHEIMFRATTSDGVGIFVIDADGSDRRTLIPPAATTNAEYDLRAPQYSPDGSRIAYMAWDEQLQQMRTWVMNADGSGRRPLMHDPQAWFEGWPVWSPDGQRLVLIREFYGPDGRPLNNTRPFAVAWVDGRAPTVETGPPMTTGSQHAEWSPDGSRILVEGNDRQLILDPNGGAWQTVPWQSNAYPAWQRVAP